MMGEEEKGSGDAAIEVEVAEDGAVSVAERDEALASAGEEDEGDDDGAVEEEDEDVELRAVREMHRHPEWSLWDVAAPITVCGLSLKRDSARRGHEDDVGMPGAPNFATAILGRWTARKLGLGGKDPPLPPPDGRGDQDGDGDGGAGGAAGGYVFRDMSAAILPGESTLLLGPSSSGKTSLMRTISDVIGGKLDVTVAVAAHDDDPASSRSPAAEGSVLVGGINPSTLKSAGKRVDLPRRTAFVDQSDLTLTPVLTVEETVRFARQCVEPNVTDFEATLTEALTMVGLNHVRGTVVGDADVRGVSGGQKRRVKVLEMANGPDVRCMFFDEITNGLDASSALTLCKIIKAAVESVGMAAFVCLLQPSEEVYETFHRLVLLTPQGEVAYSGKIGGAVRHFEGLLGLNSKPEEMTAPEFLLRCASNPAEFKVDDDEDTEDADDTQIEEGGSAPGGSVSTASALAAAFRDSDAGSALSAELTQIEADCRNTNTGSNAAQHEAQAEAEAGGGPEFAQPTSKQLTLLLGRLWKLVARNPASLQRVIAAVLFGIFVGTLFLRTPADARGTITRSGYVLTLIFLVFLNSCMAPLGDLYADRTTFYAHRRATFYRTSSYYMAQVLTSLPVAFGEALFFTVLSFFFVGMENNGGAAGYLYFLLIFLLLSTSGLAVSRVLAYALPTPDVANTLGPALLLLFVLTAGYSPQYLAVPGWLRWLAWLSPCAYCYEGALVNELHLRNVGNVTTGNAFAQAALGVPRIPYNEAPHGLSTPGLVMAFDAYMLLILTIVFDVLGCVLLHHSQKWYGPTTKRYQVGCGMSLTAPPWDRPNSNFLTTRASGRKKSSSEVESGAVKEEAGQSSSGAAGAKAGAAVDAIPPAPRAHLTARDIVYDVDVPIVAIEETPPVEEPNSGTTSGGQQQPATASSGGVVAGSVGSSSLASSSYYSAEERQRDVLITARDYGQTGKGAAKEWAIRRRLGSGALGVDTSDVSVASTGTRTGVSLAGDVTASATKNNGSAIAVVAPPEPGRLRLLSGITASFRPGTLTALMGESGAGKSTLLDVLAGYKTGGHILGDISINGRPKTDDTWRSIAGYCEQSDLHCAATTVRESLVFAARMRLRPFATIPDEAKVAFAEQILTLLDLQDFASMLVGDEASGEGLPKHARKRLTVGVELAGNPSILFADEPTSGLDSLSAAVVVASLRRAARERGLTVVCTIHQPSRDVFEAFDDLLLLRKGGVTVYNGSVFGLNEYVVSASGDSKYDLPSGVNPADHALSVFCGQLGEREDWGGLFERSDMASEAIETFASCPCEFCKGDSISIDTQPCGTGTELWTVAQRQLVVHWRTPTYMAVRFWWTVVANVITGFVFFRATEVQNVVGAIFFYVNIATAPLLSAAAPLITERAVFYREVSSGTYRRPVYGMAVQLAEIPFNMVAALVSFVIFYFMVGLSTLPGEKVGYFVLMALAVYWILPAFGQLFAFLSPNLGAAVGTANLLLTLFTLTMGFLIPAAEIPVWYVWLYWMNPLRYIQQGLVANELGGTTEGDAVLSLLSWSYEDRWWYCYVSVLLFGVCAAAGIVWATRISWLKR